MVMTRVPAAKEFLQRMKSQAFLSLPPALLSACFPSFRNSPAPPLKISIRISAPSIACFVLLVTFGRCSVTNSLNFPNQPHPETIVTLAGRVDPRLS